MPDSVYTAAEIDAKFADYYTKAQVDAAIAAALAGIAVPTPPPVVTPPAPAPITSAGVFATSKYLTTPIPAQPVIDSNSAKMVAQLTNGNRVLVDDEYSNPIYMATSTTPRVVVKVDNDPASGGTWGPCDLTGKQIPLDPSWSMSTGSDKKLSVIDGTTVYDIVGLYKATDGSWHCYWGGVYTLGGTGVSTSAASKPTGAGFSSCAGMISLADIRAGSIDHALVFASSWCAPASTFRLPAMTSDGTGAGLIPEGARIQLDPAYVVPTSWPKGVQMVARALQRYGAYCIDNGGGAAVFGRQAVTALDGQDPYPSVGFSSGYDVIGGVGTAVQYIPFARCRVLARWDGA